MTRPPAGIAPTLKPDDAVPAADRQRPSPPPPGAASPAPGQPSRQKTVWVGGHFDPAVAFALKTLALQEGTTAQALIGRALNDLLEKHRLGRPASETVLPRGGAAQRRVPQRD